MRIELKQVLFPQQKSKIKAGEGKTEGKYKFFTSSPIQSKFVDEANYDKPSLIFGTGGNASVHYCDEPFSTSTDCLVMYGRSKTELETIYNYLKSNIGILENGFKGAGLKHISKDYILAIEIDLPSEAIQLEFLQKNRIVDELIEAKQTQLRLNEDLVKSRFIEMFGDPIRNTMNWPICELSECIEFLTSGSRGWAQYFTDEGEYFITIKNVKNCRITLDDVQHIIPPNNAEAKRTKVKEGDLLISITADLGRTGVVTKEIAEHGGYINQHLTCIRLDQKTARPLYVAYYMESEAGKCQFQSKNQSAVKAGLNFNAINSLRFMLPPIELQDSFIEFIEQTDKSKFYNIQTQKITELLIRAIQYKTKEVLL